MVRSVWAWLVVGGIVGSAAGCGGGPEGPAVVPVAGVVKLDGQPLADAKVTFIPDEKGVNAAVGTTDAEGKYTLSQAAAVGAVPGSYKVTIESYRQLDNKPVPDELKGDVMQLVAMGRAKQTLPKKFSDPGSTELRKMVENASAAIDFDLQSK